MGDTKQQTVLEIYIEALRSECKKTGRPLIILCEEYNSPDGSHLVAFGNGADLKNLLVLCSLSNDSMKKVLLAAAREIKEQQPGGFWRNQTPKI